MNRSDWTGTIYILDQIRAKRGKGKEVLSAYLDVYAPLARYKCGMTPVNRWVTPPIWADDIGNTFFVSWSVIGVDNWWWQMRLGATNNPEMVQFWREIAPLIDERNRYFLSDVSDVESFCDV